jgi:UDP-N-acetylmuramate-alanine ligase
MIPKNGLLVACHDGENVDEIAEKFKGKIVWYGESSQNDYFYKNIKQTKEGLSFEIENNDQIYKIKVPIIGEYMAENICGCFAMACESGISAEKIIEALGNFKGIKRRLEKRFEGYVNVYDDIAHSPTKVISALNSLKKLYSGKIIAVFEPNTGYRQRNSASMYDNAFSDADIVVVPRLTKIKVAEDAEKPMDGKELKNVIAKTHKNVFYINDDNKLIDFLKKQSTSGDAIIFLGSHSFRGMIEQLIEQIN